MPADPVPGLSYRQEYYKGEAEDKAAIVTVGQEQVEVPFGFFKGVLMTRDLVPTEPKVQELKFYARGVGPLLSVHTDGPGGRAGSSATPLSSDRPGDESFNVLGQASDTDEGGEDDGGDKDGRLAPRAPKSSTRRPRTGPSVLLG